MCLRIVYGRPHSVWPTPKCDVYTCSLRAGGLQTLTIRLCGKTILQQLHWLTVLQWWHWLTNVRHSVLQIQPTWFTIFLCTFISFLHMFRATVCPSWGETTASVPHLVLVILYGWLSGMQGGITSTERRINTAVFSWRWTHSRPKHVEKRNRSKHTKKDCAPSWPYLQDCTGTRGQQNIKVRYSV